MKRIAVAGVTLLVVVALAGCGSGDRDQVAKPAPDAESVAPVSAEPTPEVDEPERSKRGNLVKEIGQEFGYGSSESDAFDYAEFVVKAITVDPECTGEFPEPAENGHFIRVDIQGETASDLDEIATGLSFEGSSWSMITDEGTTVNSSPGTGASWMCLKDGEMLPDVIGPGEKVAGSVILDVPVTSGTLVLAPFAEGGWEWTIPPKQVQEDPLTSTAG